MEVGIKGQRGLPELTNFGPHSQPEPAHLLPFPKYGPNQFHIVPW